MSFGDILKDWDSLKKEESQKKRTKGDAMESDAPSAPVRAPTTREQVMAYLNRHGTENKDDELDREAEEESLAKSEREYLDRSRPEASVDLHGMSAESAMDALRAFLDDSQMRGYRKVLIIHGKGVHSDGDPVLKRAVLRFLESYPGAGRSGGANKESGGSGATWLILRKD